MKSLLTKENIILNQRLRNKDHAIEVAGNILVEQGYIEKKYIDSMKKRESVISTYTENHVAIPHGLNDADSFIHESGISIVQCPDGVKYGDGTAYIIIGFAVKSEFHLDMLMALSDILEDEESIKKLVEAQTEEEVLNIIGDLDS